MRHHQHSTLEQYVWLRLALAEREGLRYRLSVQHGTIRIRVLSFGVPTCTFQLPGLLLSALRLALSA